MMKDEKHRNPSVNQKLVDEVCNFLKVSGWSFGWCLVMENENEFWQADAHRGEIHLVARDRNLGVALTKLRASILGMN